MVEPALLRVMNANAVETQPMTKVFTYDFSSTLDDLLEAEKAERSMFVRGPVRAALVILALAGLGGGIWAFLPYQIWSSLVWMCGGLALLYWLVGRPHQRRRAIGRGNAPFRRVSLAFDDSGLSLEIGGVGHFTRQWNELVRTADTKNGILFYFSDGVKNWLPNRVFSNDSERIAFLEFVRERQQPPV